MSFIPPRTWQRLAVIAAFFAAAEVGGAIFAGVGWFVERAAVAVIALIAYTALEDKW